jgi:selenocysteine lyase/cysteine desulfurase
VAADWTEVRRQFPAVSHCVFLNTATYGQTPRCAVEAIGRHLARRDESACADFLDWFDDADSVRDDVGRLTGCRGEDIAFLPTAAAALSLLIGGIDWQPGERVVTLRNEFPNNQYFPALLADRGVEFAEAAWDEFPEVLTKTTRLVAISSVSYISGFRPPLDEVARLCEQRGILLYVDGTQSIGALRMDLRSFKPDMMACDTYKWMVVPNALTFAYVSPQVRSWLRPNVVGWRSDHDWRNVDQLHTGAPRFSAKAERYEGGMLPFPLIYALGAVTRMMLDLGPAAIERRVLDLADQARGRLRRIGAKLVSGEGEYFDSPIVAASFSGVDASHLARSLAARGVLVSARHGNLRVSAHFYNDEADLERLEDELRDLIG